jgi:hypothetical protein
MKKKIRSTLFAALVMGVLCAGTVSARQLQTKASLLPACRGTCSATKPCSGGCLCEILTGTTGGCVRDPGPVRPTHEPEPR